jgi:hypothetical protein
MEVVAGVQINYLLWVTSLEEAEKGATSRILEDLQPFFNEIGLPYQIYEPMNTSDFIGILLASEAASRNGLRPIIHFDMHGTEDQGVRIVKSNEFVRWQILIERLRAINIKSSNNLCVIAPVCFSFAAVLPLADILQPSPFNTLIAPDGTITSGFVESNMVTFYRELFSTLNLTGCYNRHLSSRMRIFESLRVFVMVMHRYIAYNCSGKAVRMRRERLLREALNSSGASNTRYQRAQFRKSIKKMIAPTQDLLDQYAKSFLIDTRFNLKMSEFLRIAKEKK